MSIAAPYPSAKREGHFAPSPFGHRFSGGGRKGQGREAGEAFTLELSDRLRYSAGGWRARFTVFLLLLFVGFCFVGCDPPAFAADSGSGGHMTPPVSGSNVIGRDTVFHIPVMQVLKVNAVGANKEYVEASVAVFNFFFTLQLFFGVFACYLRLIIRVFRM